jgi:erythromycin esterase
MKRRFLATAVRSGLSTILLLYSAIAHCGDGAFAKWAAAHALPVTTLDSAGKDPDLLPLRSVIGAARVVAFGEPTHGAHEPLAFRNRLFRFLVEQMGFTAIALESGFTESRTVGSFIDGGQGDASTVAREGLTSGGGRFKETLELIQWMRDYNAASSSAGHRKVRFYGIDLAASGRISGPRHGIDYALAFLSRADPTAAEKIRASLGYNLPGADANEFGPVSKAAVAALDGSITAIAKAMDSNRSILIARGSDEEYRWALHNLDVLRQLAKCLPVTPPPSDHDNRDWVVAVACRDHAMAENVQWATENEGRKGRLLLFAHNAHIMNWKQDGGVWTVIGAEKPPMMGSYLRSAYGKDLYIIASSSATASPGLPTPEPIEDSIDSALARVGLPLMIVDVRTARQNKEVLEWLSAPRPLHANIFSHHLITPSTAVDAFFFVSNLTPAILSSDKAP